MLAAVCWLGFLLGLRHAFEADHLAAVSALSARCARRADVLRIAAAWGLGHAAMLAAAGTLLVAAGAAWAPTGPWARLGELAAGVVLAWLGADVLRRALGAGRPDAATRPAPALASRALVVGGLHGLEGSGAVVLVALPALRSATAAFVYLGLFGVGSIAGMLLSSLLLSLPLSWAARRWRAGTRALQLGVGATSVLLGGAMAVAAIK